MAERGSLFIISSPSGAGKSSLTNALFERFGHGTMKLSVSHTTRAPRPGEQDGVHYHFVDKAEFEALIEQGAFFEHAEVFGNYYGTSKLAVDAMLAQGIDVFLDIDWQGARQVRRLSPEAIGVFILPPSRDELERRLNHRGQDSTEVIAGRMAQAVSEMVHYDEYEYLVINDDFEQALTAFHAIVTAERQRRARQAVKHRGMLQTLLAE